VVMCCGQVMQVFAPEEEATKAVNDLACADNAPAGKAARKAGCGCA
jgi:hypothetical protein